jgi:hypothetical protein
MSTNEPESLVDPYAGGDQAVGNALRDFFISLLMDKNLYDYHQNRDEYIGRHVPNDDAQRLLRSTDFIEIERHILAITGSARAKPLFVVCPPY